ncbi:hypothetical protein M0M57_13330 [Flavobacterium azooxidireducens]|uniref:GLPGLI family protein n=1 Tax=Flavobacterium azooxidireducens TaxID=1871076 RepID=A0ABY4KFP2_9FLAO|nr:hypothetical protein [Flavobacterium azooxidireducens]UPQ78598.1 hypothetical protein M0M57_13330 [Flavobacterium azooxidireducens]
MKTVVYIAIFLFVTFLSLPTIVGVLDDDDADVSMVYNMSEEEEVHKSFNLKEAIKTCKQVFSLRFEMPVSKKIVTENHIQYDSVLEEIFSPPPDLS